MAQNSNLQIIKDAFEAFQRGDIPAILASLDPGVDWQGIIGTEGVLPQGSRRQGIPAVGEFFRQVAETTEFSAFEPADFIADGNHVVALGRYAGRFKRSGQRFSTDWVMVFTFQNGRVVRFREFADSAQVNRAFTEVTKA